MKIVEVLLALQSGGAERLVVDLSNEIASRGHDVTIFLLKDLSVDNRDFYLKDINPEVKVYQLGLGDGFRPNYLSKVYKALKSLNPDVVHVHQGIDYVLYAMLRMHRRAKFIYTIHSDIRIIFGGHIQRAFASKFMLHFASPLFDIPFVAISQQNYEDMLKVYPRVPTRLVYNGRKLIEPSPKYAEAKAEIDSLKHDPDSMVVIHVGRCVEVKNQQLLVECFNNIVASGQKAELILIGEGMFDTERGKKLQEIAGPNVHFLGTRNNVGDYYLLSDAFMLSSIFEGMPISLIEALLCGLPTLSTPVCGCVDLIVNGENGILSSDFSKGAYLIAMKRFFGRYPILRQRALDDAKEKRYSIAHTADGYLAIMNEKKK